jgi:hypothetical protein
MSMYGYTSDSVGAHISNVILKEMTLVVNNSTNATNTSNVTNVTNISNTSSNSSTSSNASVPSNSSASNSSNAIVPPESAVPAQMDSNFADAVSELMLNNYTQALNKIPGSRIFAYTLTNFLSAFDRLQFYYYHEQNLSYYSEILVSNVNTLIVDKGSIGQTILYSCNETRLCQSVNGLYSFLLEELDYKYVYTEPQFIERNPNGNGFFSNNLDFFFYELPGILLVYLLLFLAFRAIFKFKVSKYLRKYSFYGLLFLVVFEGNIEQFSFYFFTECSYLFSASLRHKFVNIFIIFFFFVMLVFAVGGLAWFRFHYRSMLKYFMEDSKKVRLRSILCESLERSAFPLLFGSVHALFIHDLAVQTVVLGTVEVAYFCAKLMGVRSRATRYRFKTVMLSATSLLRMVLILTLFLFETEGYPDVINIVHKHLVWIYLACWGAESVYDLGVFAKELVEAAKCICGKGKRKSKHTAKDKTCTSKSKNKKANAGVNKRRELSKAMQLMTEGAT